MCRELNREDPGPDPVPDDNVRRTLSALRAEPIRGCAVVLEIEGKVEGYALLISFWSNELGGQVCNIDELYVRPLVRRRGYATKLVRDLVQGSPLWPRERVVVELEVTPQNEQARALYFRLGFQAVKNSHMRHFCSIR